MIFVDLHLKDRIIRMAQQLSAGFGQSIPMACQDWVATFVNWYNTQHMHSGIKFVTPVSKHSNEGIDILNKSDVVYSKAKEKHPNGWSGKTKDWRPIEYVKLNNLKREDSSNTTNELKHSS